MLNRMCKNCLCLNNGCVGTNNTNWTGCVFKKTATKEAEREMTKEEVSKLIDKLNGRD